MYFSVPIINLYVRKLIRDGGGWRYLSFDPISKRRKMFICSWEEGPKHADIV